MHFIFKSQCAVIEHKSLFKLVSNNEQLLYTLTMFINFLKYFCFFQPKANFACNIIYSHVYGVDWYTADLFFYSFYIDFQPQNIQITLIIFQWASLISFLYLNFTIYFSSFPYKRTSDKELLIKVYVPLNNTPN